MKSTKEHILQTAFRLFLQKSFKEVTLNEIVEETKLSKGAFYHYFKSKEQLFTEVIDHFYLSLMKVDYTQFSQESLKSFFTDYMNGMGKATDLLGQGGIKGITMNYFQPMIDALKILPGFKNQLIQARKNELNAWVKIIKQAKKSGEIKSTLKDGHLAKLFVYTGDGVGVSLMLTGKSSGMPKEMLDIWNGIYAGIKA